MSTRDEAYPQLLSLAVHEMRTPASVVSGYLRMLQRDGEHPLSERQQRMVAEAERSCGRLVTLISELSEISKLDAGTAGLVDQTFDLFRVVEEVAAGVHEAEDRGVYLKVGGESAGAQMTGDLTRVQAAFGAIFRAVLRERASAGTVVVDRRFDHRAETHSAVVIVADQDSVQSAYESDTGAFDERRGGLGLALPIARRVVEAHGGRIWSPSGTSSRGAAVVAFPLPEQRA
jgi:signal transduction histidine kinase